MKEVCITPYFRENSQRQGLGSAHPKSTISSKGLVTILINTSSGPACTNLIQSLV